MTCRMLRIFPVILGLAALCAILAISGCGVRMDVGGSSANATVAHASKTAVGVEMVAIPGGWFEMGSADESEADQKAHRVYVDPFSIDAYPVTQEQYQKLMGKNPSHWQGPRLPVDQIRWRDAAAYCNARSKAEGFQAAYNLDTGECDFEADGYRLPTEAEYEYTLRAGTSTVYFFGDSPAVLKRYAWFKENSPRGSHPVGDKEPNPWGLHDLIGNVWQWCNDWYAEDYYGQSPAQNPRGPATGENRVVRGGCWNSRPDECGSAYRMYEMPAYSDICFAKDIHGQVGFRCVKSRSKK